MLPTRIDNTFWPDPKIADLESEDFNALWETIKTWDINVPAVYEGHCSTTGNHVIALLMALGLRHPSDYIKQETPNYDWLKHRMRRK